MQGQRQLVWRPVYLPGRRPKQRLPQRGSSQRSAAQPERFAAVGAEAEADVVAAAFADLEEPTELEALPEISSLVAVAEVAAAAAAAAAAEEYGIHGARAGAGPAEKELGPAFAPG